MLRASSEIAVATRVDSLAEKPSCSARILPWRRAATTSVSVATTTRTPKPSSGPSLVIASLSVEISQTFLEIECRGHVLQRDPKLHHGKRDFGLDSDDYRFRAAQPDHVGQIAHRPGGERIEHVQSRDIDNDAARTILADLLHQRIAQLQQVGIRERRLDGRDWIMRRLKDWD